jgi:hypothetical protein
LRDVQGLIEKLHQSPTPPKAVWKKLLQLQVCCARVMPLCCPISCCWGSECPEVCRPLQHVHRTCLHV